MSYDTKNFEILNPFTPWYRNPNIWILAMLFFLGSTFVIDLNYEYGPLIAAGLGGGGLVSFAVAFWSLGRRGRGPFGENKFDLIGESSPDGLLITDSNGNFLQVNSAFGALLACPDNEAVILSATSLKKLIDSMSVVTGLDDLKLLLARAI